MKDGFKLAKSCDVEELKQNCLMVLSGEQTVYGVVDSDEPSLFAVPEVELAEFKRTVGQFEFYQSVYFDRLRNCYSGMNTLFSSGLKEWLLFSTDYTVHAELVESSPRDAKAFASSFIQLGHDDDENHVMFEESFCPRHIILDNGLAELWYAGWIVPDFKKERGLSGQTLYSLTLGNKSLNPVFGPPSKTAPIRDEPVIPTKEFAAAMDVWEKYSVDGKLAIKKAPLLIELQKSGFSEASALAIDRICRGSEEKGGKRKREKG